jgi:hypothetical protein
MLELEYARSKFPGSDHLMVALTEEVGETAKAMLDSRVLEQDPRIDARLIRAEALQVAVVALRIFEEGDPTILSEDVQDLFPGVLE